MTATIPTVDPTVSNLDMAAWDGYERGACPVCPHPSIRLIGNRGVVDNHWRMASWRKPVAHHYRPALVATTARCDGAGQPPKRDPWVAVES